MPQSFTEPLLFRSASFGSRAIFPSFSIALSSLFWVCPSHTAWIITREFPLYVSLHFATSESLEEAKGKGKKNSRLQFLVSFGQSLFSFDPLGSFNQEKLGKPSILQLTSIAFLQQNPSCSDGRLLCDQRTIRSKAFPL